MKLVNTVTGSVSSSELGFTLSHEHIAMVSSAMRFAFPGWFDFDGVLKQAVESVKKAMAFGVRTIVDATPINLGRDVTLLRAVSEQTGVNIICATGFYYQERPFFNINSFHPDRLAEIIASETVNGIQGTDIKPGIIKCATDGEMTPLGELLIRAAARAHRLCGLPIMTHASASTRAGLRQQRIFKEENVDMNRVIIGHCDDTFDMEYILEILKNGSYAGFDRIGFDGAGNISRHAGDIENAVSAGFGKRIVMGHDSSVYCDCDCITADIPPIRDGFPEWNLRTIPEKVLPEFRRMGFSEEQITDLTTNNIRDFFGN